MRRRATVVAPVTSAAMTAKTANSPTRVQMTVEYTEPACTELNHIALVEMVTTCSSSTASTASTTTAATSPMPERLSTRPDTTLPSLARLAARPAMPPWALRVGGLLGSNTRQLRDRELGPPE